MTPDIYVLSPPTILGQGSAESLSSAESSLASQSHAQSHVSSSMASESRSRAVTEIASEAFSESEGEAHGLAQSVGRGSSRGQSLTSAETEVFTTRYAWMPTAIYSVEEQLTRLTGALMGLPRRECFVAIEGARPFRTRTADVAPAFRSSEFRAQMLPVFRAACAKRSPYMRPSDEVDADIRARLPALLNPPPAHGVPDFAPQPLPLDPSALAKSFWERRSRPAPKSSGKPKSQPKKSHKGRPTLTLIPGGAGENADDGEV
jgi:hypothetical protein